MLSTALILRVLIKFSAKIIVGCWFNGAIFDKMLTKAKFDHLHALNIFMVTDFLKNAYGLSPTVVQSAKASRWVL